ncbi:MAG: hypothetical protein RLY19_952 [Actinomycetota bacterium]
MNSSLLSTVITTMNLVLTKTVLRPTMPAIDGYLLALCDLFETIDSSRNDTLTSPSPQALHELRIAIRRARSILREGKKVLPEEIFAAMSQDLSWLSSITSEARNLDTLVDNWPAYERLIEPKDVNHLHALVREIHHRRSVVYQDMRSQLNGQRVITLINEWQVFMLDGVNVDKNGVLAQRMLKEVVTEQISRAHRKFVSDCGEITNKSSDHDVHTLRKDAKRIRYMAESFHELLSAKKEKTLLAKLLTLQDNLGEIQDLRVHEEILEDIIPCLRSMSATSNITAAEELLAQMARRRRKLRKKVIEGVLRA